MGADTAVSTREVSVEGCCDVGLFSYSFSSAGDVDLDDPYFFDSWTVRRKLLSKTAHVHEWMLTHIHFRMLAERLITMWQVE